MRVTVPLTLFLLISSLFTVSADPVAWWNFEDVSLEAAIHSSNSAAKPLVLHNAEGTIIAPQGSNDVPASPPGPAGNQHSADFGEKQDGLLCEDRPELNFAEGVAFTIEFWLKPRNYTTSDQAGIARTLIHKRGGEHGSSSFPGYQFVLLHDGTIGVRVEGQDRSSKTLVSKTVVTLDKWTHVALTRDTTGRLSLFVNGQVEMSGVYAGSLVNNGSFCLGFNRLVKSRDFYFDGLLDEIRISNTALDPADFLWK